MAKQKDTKKRRKAKGKPLSEKLAEKQAAREEEDERAEADDDDVEEDDVDEDALQDDALDGGAFDDDDDDDDVDDVDEDAEDDDVVAADRDDDDDDDDDRDGDDEEYEDDEDEELAAAEMGHQRYVIAGFFALWMVVAFILGRALEGAWSQFAARDWFVENLPTLAAVPHEGDLISRASVSLVLGAVLGAIIVGYYYVKPEIRTWADEVPEQLNKVKWPTRKEVSQNTVVVMIATAIITTYLTLLDRFWSFVTNLIYSSGV